LRDGLFEDQFNIDRLTRFHAGSRFFLYRRRLFGCHGCLCALEQLVINAIAIAIVGVMLRDEGRDSGPPWGVMRLGKAGW
jgi:hypothetical protein